ncbi:MAG TPA: SDR family oxidoreductase [Candidatus Binataceae bacterium]
MELLTNPKTWPSARQARRKKGIEMKLKGKTAIVTGGAQGIGREYAARFAREGANVVITDIREEQAQSVAREISAEGGKVVAIQSDVTSQEQMDSAAAHAARQFGAIHVLINNAAIYYDLDLTNQSIEYGRKVLDVNLFGIIIAARAVFPYMKRQRSGALINIATIGAWPPQGMGGANRSNLPDYETVPVFYYGLAKSGVVWLTKMMAMDLGRYGIRVNAIAPGVVASEATKKIMSPQGMEDFSHISALGRFLQPSDLTGTAVFLASEDSAMMTGQVLVVDAGLVMPA